MSSETPKLDSLPTEIIRRIAGCGPCESALSLLRVNWALHRACNDQLVFKRIIANGSGIPHRIPSWDAAPLTLRSPISVWARYALADSKIAQRTATRSWNDLHHGEVLATPTNLNDGNLVNHGAPQLMASHHPLIHYTSISVIYSNLERFEAGEANLKDAQAMSFCLTARIMSPEFCASTAATPRAYRQFPDNSGNWVLPQLRQILFAPFTSSSESTDSISRKQVRANRAIGVFSLDLRNALLRNQVRNVNLPPVAIRTFPPPRTTDIPFLSFMDIPLPFQPNAAEAFGSCHLATMTSPTFLQEGEWAGYYCHSIPMPTRIHFDLPMIGIRFATSSHATDPKKLFLSADGIDGVGGFHLQGQIDSRTGMILMRKCYNFASWEWLWQCMMTPFGIFGSWGDARWGGWIWLWKTTWTGGGQDYV